jgi:hypothetical protein
VTKRGLSKDDLFLGTWKLKAEGSQYHFGDPPKSGVYTIEAEGDAYLITMEWVSADGSSYNLSYRSIPDGVDYPYENPVIAEAVSMTRIDEYTLDSTSKSGGQIISHARRTLSEDGRTMTVTQSGIGPNGEEYTNLSIYEKV